MTGCATRHPIQPHYLQHVEAQALSNVAWQGLSDNNYTQEPSTQKLESWGLFKASHTIVGFWLGFGVLGLSFGVGRCALDPRP